MMSRIHRGKLELSKLTAVLMIFFSCVVIVIAAPKPPEIDAASAIVIDPSTGKIIYEKNSRAKRYPASTTKIMTAVLALEHGNPNDTITVSEEACKTTESSMHLKKGEKIKLDALLYGLLVRSANDAAMCIAEYIGGTESKFAEMMNEKAKLIGANNTHFVNPHGLHDDDHYSTAYDLALMASYAVRIPEFNKYVKVKSVKIDRSINKADVVLHNTSSRFLKTYEGADGIKTGHTKQAGRCFVGSATHDNWRIISVVLGSKKAGADTKALMDFTFKFYKNINIANKESVFTSIPIKYGKINKLKVMPSKDISIVVSRSDDEVVDTKITITKKTAPIKKGAVVGNLTAYYGKDIINKADIIAAETVERSIIAAIWIWFRNIFITILLLLIGLFIYGTKVAKTISRRRSRIAKERRRSDYIRSSKR